MDSKPIPFLSNSSLTGFKLPILLLIAAITASCNKAFISDVKRGAGYNFRPGHPELRLEVSGYLDQSEQPTIQVIGDIVYGSLVFKKKNNEFESKILVEVNITGKEGTDYSDNLEYPITITENDLAVTTSQNVFNFRKEIEVPSGQYEVLVSVTDQSSEKETVVTRRTFIPNPNNEISNITNIRLLSKNSKADSEFTPVTTYDITNDQDSIKFVFQVTSNKPGSPITIQSRLLEFSSDTTIARSMSHNNYSPSNISYQGIDYGNYEVIQTSTRVLNQPGSVLIEFAFENLHRGNYRFEVGQNLNDKGPLYKARDFSVKSKNYPSVKSPRELARPLFYLMDEKEYQRLLSIKSDDSLKNEVDRFWLRNIKNSRITKNVISLYYQRVEEANKQFSTFKEGWKTDMGMVYILFGPPWYVEDHLDYTEWAYTYDRSDPFYNFIFYSPKIQNSSFPFENFILQRNVDYFSIQYQQVQLWLSGDILTRNL